MPLLQERVSKVTETRVGVIFRSLLSHFGINAKNLFWVKLIISYFGSVTGRVFHNCKMFSEGVCKSEFLKSEFLEVSETVSAKTASAILGGV